MNSITISIACGWMAALLLDLILISETLSGYQYILLVLISANLFYQGINEHAYKMYYIQNLRAKDVEITDGKIDIPDGADRYIR